MHDKLTIEQRASIRTLAHFWRLRGFTPREAMRRSLSSHRASGMEKWYSAPDEVRNGWILPRRYRMFLAIEKL